MILISSCRILAFIIGLSLTSGFSYEMSFRKSQIVEKLAMDEAYLMISNINNPNKSILLGNAIICEDCDLKEMATVPENSDVTLIIKTQYAYDFEVRSLSSETLAQCFITSYKFAEHGTYLLKIERSAEEDTQDCYIVQTGESSRYWSPIITGLIVWIVIIVIIELCCYIHRKHYFDKLVASIFKQRLIEDDRETMPLVSPLVSSESNHLSNKTINTNSIKSKRFQALDACRGLNTMIMIFIAYGGMFIFLSFFLFSNLFYCVQVVAIRFFNMRVSHLRCLSSSIRSFFLLQFGMD